MTLWRHGKRFITRLPGSLNQTNVCNLSDKSFPSFELEKIRNFSIIAHVDHGKSTLADRLIEIGGIKTSQPQQLDSLEVERDRGITVKAQCASLRYNYKGDQYLLNLIDTPGHVDFTHEVTRSLHLSDGAVLLVDATQGVQAQTVNNFYSAFENNLAVVGTVNKIDLASARVSECKEEMNRMFDLEEEHISEISAKTGQNISAVIKQVLEHVPSPSGRVDGEFAAILHDCQYLVTSGTVLLTILVKQGCVSVRDTVFFLNSGKVYPLREVGVFLPGLQPTDSLSTGQMGYLIVRVKDVEDIVIGDTICLPGSDITPLKTLPQPKPSIFSCVFPDELTDFRTMRESLEKLVRSDTSVTMEPDSNPTLGQGWNLGFLGTLHREVFAERLLGEFGTSVIMTRPSITYRATLANDKVVEFNSARDMPESYKVLQWEEPLVAVTIVTPAAHISTLISYCMSCRGVQKQNIALSQDRLLLKYEIPLIETVSDFYSSVKMLSSGYATCDMEEGGFRETDLTRVDVLFNGQMVEGLSMIVRSDVVRDVSRETVTEIAKMMPRELYKIVIQCVVGNKVQARAEVKPLRKDVTKALYGGDKTRAMKLLARQREGKKKLKDSAVVKVPKTVFRKF